MRKKLQKLFRSLPSLSFRDIGRHGDTGPAQLRHQSELLRSRKFLRQLVNYLHQHQSLLPNQQVLVMSGFWLLGHSSLATSHSSLATSKPAPIDSFSALQRFLAESLSVSRIAN